METETKTVSIDRDKLWQLALAYVAAGKPLQGALEEASKELAQPHEVVFSLAGPNLGTKTFPQPRHWEFRLDPMPGGVVVVAGVLVPIQRH